MRAAVALGHLDADSFYVSAERVRAPFLHGKPVGVLGNQGACVIAKSYEMKAAGVKTGTPIWDAVRLCPQGVYLKRDFRWYEVLSRRMLELMREFSPAVEYYSIDEFFFRAVPHRGLTMQETAEAMRDRIFKELRLPVTVGIARTRTLAKLISDTAKPFGAIAMLDRDAEWALLEQTPVTGLCGIALRRAARLEPYGVKTCLDLAFLDRKLVRSLITRSGEAIWWELHGDPVTPLHVERPPHKMLSRGGSLGEAARDPLVVNAWLTRHMERLIEELEYHGVLAGMLSIYLVHKNGRETLARAPLLTPTNRFTALMEIGHACLERAQLPGEAVQRLHITASRLQRPGFVQRSLFDPPDDPTDTEVADVKRAINDAVGRFALRSAATLPLTEVYQDTGHGYEICDVHGKMCF